ncbi:Transient receptor putative cation channel sub A member 1 [Tyrophagus putrescentiae]|nr:Transient receptor putative cation channel sub A member 1 [Tyrophagus putrescentiae]
MNNTAKLVNATLKWKVRGGKQQQHQHQLQTTTINGGHHHNYHPQQQQQQLANHLADFESGYRSLLAEQHHSSGSFSGGGGGATLRCSQWTSPYRILKAAEAGNLEVFIKLYRQNNARLKFTDKYGKRAIHYATAKNNIDILRFIVEHDDEINAQDINGDTALHHAVMNAAVECLSFLIESGADTSILNGEMNGPIHVAVISNQVAILREMVKCKERVNVMLRGKHGRSALHFAAITDHDECVRILLQNFNCCPKTPCNNGSYAIHEAAKNASAKALEAILEWGENIGIRRESMMKFYDAEGNVPLHSAVHSGDIKAVALCLNSGAVLSTQQHDLSTPVHLAASQGAIEIIRLMFAAQPQEKAACLAICDAQAFSPLHCACAFDHEELVRFLVKGGESDRKKKAPTPVWWTREGRSPLLLAGARAAWRSVLALIELGSNVSLRDNNSRNIFHHIVLSGGELDKFTQLIATRVEGEPVDALLNDRDLLGCTPLHYASRDGQFKTIQSLLQMGASPLHFAARYGRLHTARHLLESHKGHLIINEMDGDGATPLHIAAANGHAKIVQAPCCTATTRAARPLHLASIGGHLQTVTAILLVHSHLLDQTDKDGNCSLTLAALNNWPAVAATLLSLDCRLIANNEGYTPIDYAIINRNAEVAKVMVMHAKRGEEIMRSRIKKYSSLVEGLIANMPDVVKTLLDRGIERSNESEDSPGYWIKYNFRHLLQGKDRSSAGTASSSSSSSSSSDQPLPILNLMICYGREDLLSHPLCVKYLQAKWNSYGMYFHVLNMSFYLLFLSLITLNGLKVIDVAHASQPRLGGKEAGNQSSFIQNLVNDNSESQREARNVTLLSWAILLLVVLNILKEFYQIYHQLYFSPLPAPALLLRVHQHLRWLLYLSSGIMSLSFLFFNIHDSYLYISTAVSVFIAWFNLLFYLQRFNRGGIYVVMFLEILSTLIKVIFLFSVLIIAFGLSFYILFAKFDLLAREKASVGPILAMIRVGTMMLGELAWWTTRRVRPSEEWNGTAAAAEIERWQLFTSLLFLVIFIILMPILLMNLLIGLAVGDIDTVRKDAQLKRLTMQVDLHTDLERKLPRKFIQLTDKKEIYEYPNRCCGSSLFFLFYSKYILNRPNKMAMTSSRGPNMTQHQHDLLRDLARHSELQLELLRLIVQKMEIQTENDFGSDDGEDDGNF